MCETDLQKTKCVKENKLNSCLNFTVATYHIDGLRVDNLCNDAVLSGQIFDHLVQGGTLDLLPFEIA